MSFTVQEIRRRWKPSKLQLQDIDPYHPTNIRIHRACSWLAQDESGKTASDDLALISLWVSLNSLYGRWDAQTGQPLPDWAALDAFLGQMLGLDEDGVMENLLVNQRTLVMHIMEDAYLTRYFWQSPDAIRANKARKGRFDAAGWYHEKQWHLLLLRLLERVYMMRCQLVHGAATFGSQINRRCLRQCVLLMRQLVPAVLLVMVKHGANEDWGQLCYPPIGDGPA